MVNDSLIEGSQQFAVQISQHKTRCVVYYAIVNVEKWRAEVVHDLLWWRFVRLEDALLRMYVEEIQCMRF